MHHLADIAYYTVQRWGYEQWEVYREKLYSAFERIEAFPDIGTQSAHLPRGTRTFPIAEHVVMYIQSDAGDVVIIGIYHKRSSRKKSR